MPLERGFRNAINEPLVEPSKVLHPPLHIELGLMKQFIKALNKEGQFLQYIMSQFLQFFDAKLKEGIFDGRQIRKLLRDEVFVTKMTLTEKKHGLITNTSLNIFNEFETTFNGFSC